MTKQTSIENKFEVLNFLIQGVRACINLEFIEKILPLMALETMPCSPRYVAGLMNYSGSSVPVIDLAILFSLSRNLPYTIDTPIILCSDGEHQVAFIIDKILGLSTVKRSDLELNRERQQSRTPFTGVVKINDELSLLIDVKQLLAENLIGEDKNFDMTHEV